MRRALAFNALLVAAAWVAALPGAPAVLRLVAAGVVILVLPGSAWLGAFDAVLTPAKLALAVASVSLVSALAGCAASALTGPPVGALPVLAVTALTVNAGLLVGRRTPRFEPGVPWGALTAVFAAGWLATGAAALALVPPLEDHDMEVRGTAYGLLASGRPYFTSNREVYLPMSHPVGFNVLVADALAVTDEIDAVRPSYDSARRAEAAARAGTPFGWEAAWRADYEAFLANPALAGTRAPSALLAGAVLALLFDLGRRVAGRLGYGVAIAGYYATVPETIVRSAYAGYFVETVFAMLVAVTLFTEEDPGPGLPALAAAGALLAVLDHKTAVLVLGICGWTAVAAVLRGDPPLRRAGALVSGFAAGTLVWWAYGFWVDARVFVADHLRKHIAHRILLNDVRLVPDPVHHYAPSIPELWAEFTAHTGYVLVPLALAAAVAALVRRSDRRVEALAVWFLSGAVAYSLVDWRQTKHLMNGLAPMVVLAVALGARSLSRPLLRRAVLALLIAGAAIDLAADGRLLADFRSLRISGASDVDGW